MQYTNLKLAQKLLYHKLSFIEFMMGFTPYNHLKNKSILRCFEDFIIDRAVLKTNYLNGFNVG